MARLLTEEVVGSLRELRAVLDEKRGNRGPSIARLREISSAMGAHASRGQHALALEALAPIAHELDWLAKDSDRVLYVEALRSAAEHSQAVIDFDAMGLAPRGVVALEDRAAVLVGSRAVVGGDRIMDEILVRSVTSDEVVFEFRGVVIRRRVPLHFPETWER